MARKSKITYRPELWGTIAQWASAIVATIGLTLILLQIITIKENALRGAVSAREQSARQIFATYMNWGLQYPEFTLKPVPFQQFESEKKLRYEWFVLNFLFAYDETFTANPDDKSWIVAFKYDIPSHLNFICAHTDPTLLGQFEEFTQNMVIDAAREAGFRNCNGHSVQPKK